MFSWIALGIGVFGILFGLNCYRELWKWAKQCQRGRIVIAYNRRVQLDASLAEVLAWISQLQKQEAKGREIYRVHKMSVSILKDSKVGTQAKTTVKTLRDSRRSRKTKVTA